jgi:hypothetical protein
MPILSDRYRHSASSGNMFLADPSAFIWRYGMGNWDDGNSRMNMGNASEFAANVALRQDLTDDQAAECAVAEFDRLNAGEICAERDVVGEITKQFLAVMRPLGKPLTYQAARTVHGGMWGLTREIIVKTDFGYGDFYIDTKATLRCPSTPSVEHIRQQALYARILEKPCELLYATPKKSARYSVVEEDVDIGFRQMIAVFRRIENLSERCASAMDATEIIGFSGDSFYWSDDAKAKASEIWRI